MIDGYLRSIEVTDKCPYYLLPRCLLHCQSVKALDSRQVMCQGFNRFPKIFGMLRVETREESLFT